MHTPTHHVPVPFKYMSLKETIDEKSSEHVYCRGRAVTNVGKTCGPTPCFILALNTFKLN